MIDVAGLSWKLPTHLQQKNRCNVHYVSDEEIEKLILPDYGQDCWENCAILISTIDNERLIPYLPRIFEWYKDLNWPGIEIIDQKVKQMSPELIRDALKTTIQRAQNDNDTEWCENLYSSFQNILD